MPLQLNNLQVQAGIPAQVTLDVSGPAGATDDVLVEFQVGGTRQVASPAGGSINPIPVSGTGATQTAAMQWDTIADLGAVRPSVHMFASLVSDPSISVSALFPGPPRVDGFTV